MDNVFLGLGPWVCGPSAPESELQRGSAGLTFNCCNDCVLASFGCVGVCGWCKCSVSIVVVCVEVNGSPLRPGGPRNITPPRLKIANSCCTVRFIFGLCIVALKNAFVVYFRNDQQISCPFQKICVKMLWCLFVCIRRHGCDLEGPEGPLD